MARFQHILRPARVVTNCASILYGSPSTKNYVNPHELREVPVVHQPREHLGADIKFQHIGLCERASAFDSDPGQPLKTVSSSARRYLTADMLRLVSIKIKISNLYARFTLASYKGG